jgi:hypothetical protein
MLSRGWTSADTQTGTTSRAVRADQANDMQEGHHAGELMVLASWCSMEIGSVYLGTTSQWHTAEDRLAIVTSGTASLLEMTPVIKISTDEQHFLN